MATIQQNGSAVTGNYWSGSSTNNDNGTAKNIGSSSTVLENLSLGRLNVSAFASVVVDGVDTDPALSGGVFAYSNNRPTAPRLTSSLATVSNTTLLSGSSIPSTARSINTRVRYVSTGYATAFRAGYFNLYTGRWTTNPTAVNETPGTDNAAAVTRSVPGTLRYMTSAKNPVVSNYSPKNT